MPLHLINRPCVLILRDQAATDDFGNEIDGETRVDAVCELQQLRRDEVGDAEVSDTLWRLLLPAGTAIDTGDAVEVDGDVYELVGAPWRVVPPWTGVEHHVEATARRVAGVGEVPAS